MSNLYPTFQGVGSPSPAPFGVTGWGASTSRPGTTDKFNAMLGLQDRARFSHYGTNLDLLPVQVRHEMGANTELRNSMADFARVGKLEDFYDYVEKEGRTGPIDRVLDAGATTLTGLSDLLSVGNYTTAGFMQELLRTGSAWEALKQAGIEFANAMPVIEMQKARRPTFVDVFGENWEWGNRWYGSAAGFVADVLFDPINLIPGGMLAKGATRGAKFAGRAVPRGMKNAFNEMFRFRNDLLNLGEAGERVSQLLDTSKATADRESLIWVRKMNERMADIDPDARRLVSLVLSDPQRLDSQFQIAVRDGVFSQEHYDKIRRLLPDLAAYNRQYLDAEVNAPLGGLIDRSVAQRLDPDTYLPGMASSNPRMQKMFATSPIGNRPSIHGAGAPGSPRNFNPSFRKDYRTLEERLYAQLSGDLAESTELDVLALHQKRGVDSIRNVATRQLIENVLNDPVIAQHATAINPSRYRNPRQWAIYKKSLEKQNPGYQVLEITRNSSRTTRTGRIVNHKVIQSAHLMPEPIVKYVTKGDQIMRDPSMLGKFFEALKGLQDMWKGWATFGIGYHQRNGTGMAFDNFVVGMANNHPIEFLKRYGYAHKAIETAMGQGQLNGRVEKALSKAMGIPYSQLKFPTIRFQGRVLSAAEVMELAEKSNAIHGSDMLYGVAEDVLPQLWKTGKAGNPKEAIQRIAQSGLDYVIKAGLEIPHRTQMSKGSRVLANIAGLPSSTLMREHRAVGHLIETQGRMALFIDQLMKGVDPVAAGRECNKWHFDYRRLTEFEKKTFGPLMPFYAWSRFAAPRMVMAMLEHPQKIAGMAKLHKMIESMSPDYQDLPTPDFYEEVMALQLPWLENDKPLFAQIDLPMTELNRLNITDVRSSLNPIIKLAMETAPNQGVNFLTGAPIERYPGEESGALDFLPSRITPALKTEHVLTNLVPPIGKLLRAANAAERDEGWDWVRTELTGVRFRSLDVRRVLRAQTFERRKLARDFKARLRQEGIDI